MQDNQVNKVKNILEMSKIKVLFVCLGNICRSPLAKGLFQQKIEQGKLTAKIMCDSCGTSDYHIGEQPDHRTIKNAARNGLILNHQARQFIEDDFYQFDYIIAMDSSNFGNILSMTNNPNLQSKAHKMRDFDTPDFKGTNVPDPYFGGERGFQEVFEILDRCTQKLMETILNEKSN
jgi:protein-tyrosine phosphatase